MCLGKSVGLARYPTTLVEDRGSVSTTAECADNAHIRDGSSLSITCTSNGEWSQTITPVCDCDDEYEEVKDKSGRSICQGQCVQLYHHSVQIIESLSSTAKFTCFSNTSNTDCGKIFKYFCQKQDGTIFTFLTDSDFKILYQTHFSWDKCTNGVDIILAFFVNGVNVYNATTENDYFPLDIFSNSNQYKWLENVKDDEKITVKV